MKKAMRLGLGIALLAVGIAAQSASANTLIDNSGSTGSVNFGWFGSGQSLTVPGGDNYFESFTFYVDSDSNGKQFDLLVTDAFNGGSTLFSSLNNGITTGANTININQAFTSGSTIYVVLDYNGFSGATVHFGSDNYAGGISSFGPFLGQASYSQFDLAFKASFSGGPSSVPDAGSTLGLMGIAFTGLAALRRKQA